VTKNPKKEPKWLQDFEQMANKELGPDVDGASCAQIHPIIERWFMRYLENDPPTARPSVEQAMACLTTEVLNTLPPEVVDAMAKGMDEDELALWIENILLVGRAFEASLRNGELDDL
jgi:hypothetical protein